jgi:hypothetical protein
MPRRLVTLLAFGAGLIGAWKGVVDIGDADDAS